MTLNMHQKASSSSPNIASSIHRQHFIEKRAPTIESHPLFHSSHLNFRQRFCRLVLWMVENQSSHRLLLLTSPLLPQSYYFSRGAVLSYQRMATAAVAIPRSAMEVDNVEDEKVRRPSKSKRCPHRKVCPAGFAIVHLHLSASFH